ncbi:hypothetical protein [Demequina soli]|uniref:hypothetical protein n=1 Tax=Demequina soli TaxID=1638987 RepID=UPI000784B362|nr:hypothetical protein [Demequina soli]
MSRSLFLVQDNQLVEMTARAYVDEYELQALIETHPDVIPGAEINPEDPRRWLVIAREPGLATDESGRDRFSIDHLLVDQDGIPTIVEVKRSSDTRIRREVVGQMFDYAANGVKYWPVSKLRDWLEAREGGAEGAAERIVHLLDAGDEDRDIVVEGFWETVEANLTGGKLRLLFVADHIPAELRRIIEFLNDQMQQTEVLGIAIARHRSEGLQLLAPQVFGRTETAASAKRAGDVLSLAEYVAKSSVATRTVGARLDEAAQAFGWEMRTGTKSRMYGTPETGTLVTWYPTYDSIELSVGFMSDLGLGDEVATLLESIGDFRGKAASRRNPNIACASLVPRWDEFQQDFLPAYAAARSRAARLASSAGS